MSIPARLEELPRVEDLAGLEALVADRHDAYLRWSRGPEHEGSQSYDALSGAVLPGLCVSPLQVEPWWEDRSVRTWLARRVHDYEHLAEAGEDIIAWVLTGREVGRGPDNEPLVDDIHPLALLPRSIVAEAREELERAGDTSEWGPLARGGARPGHLHS